MTRSATAAATRMVWKWERGFEWRHNASSLLRQFRDVRCWRKTNRLRLMCRDGRKEATSESERNWEAHWTDWRGDATHTTPFRGEQNTIATPARVYVIDQKHESHWTPHARKRKTWANVRLNPSLNHTWFAANDQLTVSWFWRIFGDFGALSSRVVW